MAFGQPPARLVRAFFSTLATVRLATVVVSGAE